MNAAAEHAFMIRAPTPWFEKMPWCGRRPPARSAPVVSGPDAMRRDGRSRIPRDDSSARPGRPAHPRDRLHDHRREHDDASGQGEERGDLVDADPYPDRGEYDFRQ